MFGQDFLQNHGVVMIPPQTMDDAAVDSAWIDMSNYGHATLLFAVGDIGGATMAVTINEATDNSGSGEQVLTYTNLKSTGQRLIINTVVGTFVVGETLTQTGGNSNTAEITRVSSSFLLVRSLTAGTTWGNGNTVTGGTSSATAKMDGTGQDEDLMMEIATAPSSTFTIPAVTFKNYAIEVDADSLTVADNYTHIQFAFASAANIAGGQVILSNPRHRGIPMPAVLGTQKMIATFA